MDAHVPEPKTPPNPVTLALFRGAGVGLVLGATVASLAVPIGTAKAGLDGALFGVVLATGVLLMSGSAAGAAALVEFLAERLPTSTRRDAIAATAATAGACCALVLTVLEAVYIAAILRRQSMAAAMRAAQSVFLGLSAWHFSALVLLALPFGLVTLGRLRLWSRMWVTIGGALLVMAASVPLLWLHAEVAAEANLGASLVAVLVAGCVPEACARTVSLERRLAAWLASRR